MSTNKQSSSLYTYVIKPSGRAWLRMDAMLGALQLDLDVRIKALQDKQAQGKKSGAKGASDNARPGRTPC